MAVNKRIQWIDIARGIAILLVIIGHSLGNYWPGYLGNFIFVVHMPIFFILSGYLYHLKEETTLFKSGVKNLLIPYIGTVVIELLCLIISKFLKDGFFYSRIGSVKGLLLSSFYGIGVPIRTPFNIDIVGIGAIWFLMAFFGGTLIFNLIMRLKIADRYKFLIVIIVSLFGYTLNQYITLPFSLNISMAVQIFFFAGYWIKKIHLITKLKWWHYLLFMVFWIYVASIGLFVVSDISSPNIIINYVAGITSSLVLIKFSIFIENLNKIQLTKSLTFFGVNSLAILAFHLIDLDSVTLWYKITQHLIPYLPYLLVVLIGIIYRILFVTFAVMVVKKLPLAKTIFFPRKFKKI